MATTAATTTGKTISRKVLEMVFRFLRVSLSSSNMLFVDSEITKIEKRPQ